MAGERKSVVLEGLDAALVQAFVQLDQAERARFAAHQRCGELVRAMIRVRHPGVPPEAVCELFPRPDGRLDLAWTERAPVAPVAEPPLAPAAPAAAPKVLPTVPPAARERRRRR